MGGVQWGTVGEWVAGLGATLAVVALFLVRWLDNGNAKKREHRAEAARVSAWIDRDEQEGWIHVRNGGQQPIYRWHADISWARAASPAGLQNESRTRGDANDGPLAPDNTNRWPIEKPFPDDNRRSLMKLAMSFQDERGYLWKLEDGRLEDLGPQPFATFGSFFGQQDQIRAVEDGDPRLTI